MILLESYDRAGVLAELEPATGHIRWRAEGGDHPIHGAIASLDGHNVILYRDGDLLHFRVDDTDIMLTDDMQFELSRGVVNIITVSRGGHTIFRFAYKPYVPDKVDKWRMYLNPLIEEEHFDFGLFIYNITKNIENRRRVYRR
jgi:hypothetical protein